MSEVIVFKFSKDWDFGNSLFCEAADVIAEDGEKFIRHEDHERELAALREELKWWQAGSKAEADAGDEARSALKSAEQRNTALKSFACEMVEASFEGGSFDGGDIQDIAVKYGLLQIEQRTEECGEVCACSEYGFPSECYRKTDLLKPAESGASHDPARPLA